MSLYWVSMSFSQDEPLFGQEEPLLVSRSQYYYLFKRSLYLLGLFMLEPQLGQ